MSDAILTNIFKNTESSFVLFLLADDYDRNTGASDYSDEAICFPLYSLPPPIVYLCIWV